MSNKLSPILECDGCKIEYQYDKYSGDWPDEIQECHLLMLEDGKITFIENGREIGMEEVVHLCDKCMEEFYDKIDDALDSWKKEVRNSDRCVYGITDE